MLGEEWNKWRDYLHKIGMIGLIMLLILPSMLINPVSEVFADEADYDISVDGETVTIVSYLGTDTDVTIPEQIQGKDVTSIATLAFQGKTLDKVTIPRTVTTIGAGAFMGSGLESLILNEGLIDIGAMAFAGNRMANVDIPGTVTTIGAGAFSQGSLSTVTLHEGLETIGEQAFWSNELTSVIIPEGVTTIGEKAFILNKLEEVTLPGTITSMGSKAFLGGAEGENTIHTLIMQEGLSSIGESAFQENLLETVQIPGSVSVIEKAAFMGNKIQSVILNEGIEVIGEQAFEQNQLEEVVIPDTVTHITSSAFLRNQIHTLTLPDSVGVVGAIAFGFNPLTEVKVYNDEVVFEFAFGMPPFFRDPSGPPGSITLFGRSGSTTEAYVLALPPEFGYSFQSLPVCGDDIDFECVVNDDDTLTITGYDVNAPKHVVIPDTIDGKTVTNIEEIAFRAHDLTGVELPNSLIEIGRSAFYWNSITTVTIPSGVTSVEDSAFSANLLVNVSIPDSVTTIETYAFYKNSLTEVTIPSGVDFVGRGAFSYNPLTIIHFEGTPTVIDSSAFHPGFFAYPDFKGWYTDENFEQAWDNTVPAPMTIYGKWEAVCGEDTIFNCKVNDDGNTITITGYTGSDTDVIIPGKIDDKDVTAIGEDAFAGKQLVTVELPYSVTTIEAQAFSANELASVTIMNDDASIEESAFDENQTNPTELTIYGCPGSTAEAHANDKGYSFAESLEAECLKLDLTANETSSTKHDVSISVNVNKLPESINELKWAKGEQTLAYFQGGGGQLVVSNEFTASENDTYTAYVEDVLGRERIAAILIDNIDKTSPEVTGVTNGAVYDEPVTISFNEGSATLNGIAFTSGTTVNVNGEYELIVTDGAGNETIVMFELKQSDYIVVDNGSGTVMITGYRGTATRIEIPSILDGKVVTAIGNNAFSEKSLEDVIIPDSVAIIGDYAFEKNELQEIEVPGSVRMIGHYAFRYNHLASVTLSEGLETIGKNAFLSNAITELIIPDTVTFIDHGAFVDNNIMELTLGANVQTIAAFAFYVSNIQEVTIPESVQSIGMGAFQQNQIKEFTVLGNEVILDKNVLHVMKPENPEQLMIRGYCDSTANKLASNWGYSFQQLDADECLMITLTPSETELTNQDVTVQINVVSDSANVVALKWAQGSRSLVDFQDEDGDSNDVTGNQFTVSANDTYTVYVKDRSGNEKVGHIQIANIDKTPPVVTGVVNGEVYDEPVTISFNEGIAALNGIAFTSGTAVTVNGEYELIVTDGAGNVTTVMFELKQSDYIFVDNGSGTVMITGYRGTDSSIEIPSTLDGKTVTIIGNYAFSEKSLERVMIPDSVASIGAYAFYRNGLQEIEIPGSVKTLAKHAFSENHLTSVTFSEGLETIGQNAFWNNHITELTIPDTVTLIDYGAFVQNNLTDLTLGENIQTIAAFAFWSGDLQEVTIPASVQSIGEGAFMDNQIQQFTVLNHETVLDRKMFHDRDQNQNPENPEQLMIRGYCDSTANKLASNWGYSFQQLDADECLMITLTPSETELTNEDVTVQINVVSDSANVVALKWAQGSRSLVDFQDEDVDSNDVTGNQFTVSANDTYTVYVKDRSGNEKVEHIQIANIDKTPPVVTGVTSGEVYDEPVTISFNEGTATLDGNAFTNGATVSVNGEYELIVTDGAGNATTVMFELKQSDYIFVDNGSGTVTITGYRGTDSSIEIPNILDGKAVTAIGNNAFSEKSLESVIIPDSVTSIGSYAFHKNGLQEVAIPDSVTTIGDHAFDDNHVASVTLSEGLETIGANAFLSNAIAELTIPASVQAIGEGAFQQNQMQEFTVLSHEAVLDRNMLHDHNQNPENLEEVTIYGYCGSTANELANDRGYSFQQLDANECLIITLTPNETELTNKDVTVQINVVSDSANVVALKWAQGSRNLVDFQDEDGDSNDVTGNQFTVSANGIYTVYVKDRSGNEKVEQIRIANINKSLLNLNVQIVDGKIIALQVYGSDSIQQLKQKIEDSEGIAVENQKMIFGETVLEDGRTLADYNIPDEATLQLIILSADASLKQFAVELEGERTLELDPSEFDHDIGQTEQETIEIFADANDAKAQITLNGISFDRTQLLPLNEGENIFTMIVTAENGHEQTYTIIVSRQAKAPSSGGGYIPSSDISLDKLEVMINGENILLFDSAQFQYDLGDTEAESLEIIVKAHHPNAKITLDGEAFADKKTLLLNEEKNIFKIVVTAENGDKQTYAITVKRLAKVPFTDIAGHWAEGYIKKSYWGNMFYGYSDKTFRPDNQISRIEVISVLTRLLELDEQKQVPFIDVQSIGKDAMQELEKAYAHGVVKGYPDQTFKPHAHVTRAHLALILYRTYGKINGKPYQPKQLTYFSDISGYDQETQNAIAMLVELNIAEGFDWNFMPDEQTTRAEAAKILVKFKEVLGRLENN